ncbi:unnamed protein product, partial [Staurois parvus]
CPQSLSSPRYCVRTLWSSPVLCLHSLVISCYCVPQSLSSPVTGVRSLGFISCTVSAVSGHCSCTVIRSLCSSPVRCPSSLWVIFLLTCPQSQVISSGSVIFLSSCFSPL